MTFVETYAQLFVVAVPVLAIAGLNLFLLLGGERGTLLVPSAPQFGPVLRPRADGGVPASRPARPPHEPANEPDFRRAA